jgi:hypothetical protein
LEYFLVAGIFGFAQRDLNVPENGGTVQIAVEATANLSTPVTLRYVNSNHSCQLFILDLHRRKILLGKRNQSIHLKEKFLRNLSLFHKY